MAAYKPYDPNVEVKGNLIALVLNVIPAGKGLVLKIFQRHGVVPKEEKWFPQKNFLDAIREMEEKIGEHSIFVIGKGIIKGFGFPPIDSLSKALKLLDIYYHMYHRINGRVLFNPETGEMYEGIGHYKVVEFDEELRTAIVVSDTPYSDSMDKGILTEVVREYKPAGSSSLEKVIIDETKETKTKGGDSTTFIIHW